MTWLKESTVVLFSFVSDALAARDAFAFVDDEPRPQMARFESKDSIVFALSKECLKKDIMTKRNIIDNFP